MCLNMFDFKGGLYPKPNFSMFFALPPKKQTNKHTNKQTNKHKTKQKTKPPKKPECNKKQKTKQKSKPEQNKNNKQCKTSWIKYGIQIFERRVVFSYWPKHCIFECLKQFSSRWSCSIIFEKGVDNFEIVNKTCLILVWVSVLP